MWLPGQDAVVYVDTTTGPRGEAWIVDDRQLPGKYLRDVESTPYPIDVNDVRVCAKGLLGWRSAREFCEHSTCHCG